MLNILSQFYNSFNYLCKINKNLGNGFMDGVKIMTKNYGLVMKGGKMKPPSSMVIILMKFKKMIAYLFKLQKTYISEAFL